MLVRNNTVSVYAFDDVLIKPTESAELCEHIWGESNYIKILIERGDLTVMDGPPPPKKRKRKKKPS